jgi:ESCRT-I complex subunit TSG101
MGRVQNDIDALRKTKDSASMEKLMSMQSVLKQRGEQCDEGYLGLQREKEALEHQLQLVLTNTDVLETWVEANKKADVEFDIDHAFEPCDALSKQLLECTSADLALEDIFYALDRAVQEGAIAVDAYLKHVRSLAREQFFHKALAERVRTVQAQTQIDMMAARASQYNR